MILVEWSQMEEAMKTLNALFNHMDTCSERERDIVCWSLIAIAYGGTFIGFIVGR